MDIYRALIVPDVHSGVNINGDYSHDVNCFELLIDVCNSTKFDGVYVLGDFADFYSVSSHPKDPGIISTLKEEVYTSCKLLERLSDATKGAGRHFLCGNHEARAEKFIARNCPQLFGMVDIEEILCLSKYGFNYHSFNPQQLVRIGNTDIYCRHQPYSLSVETSAKISSCSIINGHDHQIKRAIKRTADGRRIQSISCGALINMQHKIAGYTEKVPNWSHGFGVVTVINSDVFYEQVEIINNRLIFSGECYIK